jgi:hypothetical protein
MKELKQKQTEKSRNNYYLDVLKELAPAFGVEISFIQSVWKDAVKSDNDPETELRYQLGDSFLAGIQVYHNFVSAELLFKKDIRESQIWKKFVSYYRKDNNFTALVFRVTSLGTWGLTLQTPQRWAHGRIRCVIPSIEAYNQDARLIPVDLLQKEYGLYETWGED